MADLFVRGASADAAGGVSTITISIDGTGCDALAVCISHNQTDDVIQTVTYAGASCSALDTSNNGTTLQMAVYQKIAPATGVNNVVVTFTAPLSHSSAAGAHMFNGTDQTTPFANVNKASGSSVTASVTQSSIGAANSGFDGVAATPSTSINTPTQTQSFVDNNPTECVGGSHAAGNGSVTFQWTITNTAPWASISFEVQSPSGPPLINTQPTDQTVTFNNGATFSVVASSQTGASLSYQWKENGSNITNATNASVSISPTATTDQNGVLTVSVWDVNGTTASGSGVLRLNFNGGFYAQESATTNHYQLEDASGSYLMESWSTTAAGGFFPPFYWGDLDGLARRFYGDRLN